MTSHINFTRDPSHPDREFAGSLPLFDGKMPTSFLPYRGVTLDGAPIEFQDETTADRLHQALVDGKALGSSAVFDCLIFAALMLEVPIGKAGEDKHFRFSEETEERTLDPADVTVAQPINLGSIRGGNDEITYCHTVVPAHTPEGATYLHRLGIKTVCLSSLTEAMGLYRCTVAHPMASIQFDGQERVVF
ncbi:MAG: hypothetical protein QG623_362 [Patescibacteria group bacterium]|nr:hypothetical protein [Patescibacteria group bacterium]